MLPLLCLLAVQTGDTLTIRTIAHPPRPDTRIDSAALGEPTIRIRTGQGSALVWLLRAADTVFVAARIPDSTRYWGDDFVVSLDTRGDGAPDPQHDDFQLDFRRVVDSSIVFRGRNGRWEPPRGDPDWRLGLDRAGGGWEVSSGDGAQGWSILLRLDPAWFAGEPGRLPRVAFRVYDDSPSGWFAWPPPQGSVPTTVEQAPNRWVPLR
jgi:hypothetical protein